MKKAYALLGFSFLIVFIGVYLVIERAEAPTDGIYADIPTEDESSITQTSNTTEVPMSLTLTSSAFLHNESIPSKYTCDGDNINPELIIEGVPEGTASLVLVMDDPDIPQSVKDSMGIEKFDHWSVYNIPPDTTVIEEGVSIGFSGLTSRGQEGYTGPCPPDGEHRYIFRLYALPGSLNFIKQPTLDEIEAAAKGSALETAELIGTYKRQ